MRAVREIRSHYSARMTKLMEAIEFGNEWADREVTYVQWAAQLKESSLKKQDNEEIRKAQLAAAAARKLESSSNNIGD
jgi:hypothetical protein